MNRNWLITLVSLGVIFIPYLFGILGWYILEAVWIFTPLVWALGAAMVSILVFVILAIKVIVELIEEY